MKWIIKISNKNEPEIQKAINYCKSWLSEFDTSKLEYVRIDNGRTDYESFYGRCHYPQNRQGFKVSCQINKSIKFPFRKLQRRSPIYFVKKGVEIKDSHELYEKIKVYDNFHLGQHCQSYNNGVLTSWVRLYENVTYNNFAECIISIFGHEIGHFLSKTKQIQFKNTEIEIDKFEDQFLFQYREFINKS